MSKEVFTLNPYKQVLLSEQEYIKLAEMANATEALVEKRAKEMYQEKGTASLCINLVLREGLTSRNYESIKISDPMLIQSTDLGCLSKESINQINASVRKVLVDFHNEYQKPVEEARKEYKRKTSKARFWSTMFCAIVFFGVLCGLLQSIVFQLLK